MSSGAAQAAEAAKEAATGNLQFLGCADMLPGLDSDNNECKGEWAGFVSGDFISENYTAPAADECYQQNPGDSNSTNMNFISWSVPGGSTPDNFTEYDLAILYPQPVFVAVWGKQNSTDADGALWSDSRVMCLPGNVTVAGSRNITEAQKASGSEKLRSSLLGVVVLATFAGFIL
jgi:hypothetical protein